MAMAQGPRGINFTYAQTEKALDDQLRWIDQLDGKAGILLGAEGVVAGLILTGDSVLLKIPRLPAMFIVVLLLGALVLALLAFATRHYEIAPDVESLGQQMQTSTDEQLKVVSLESLFRALDINEPKVNQKATFLYYSGFLLLGALFLFAAHFMYFVIDP